MIDAPAPAIANYSIEEAVSVVVQGREVAIALRPVAETMIVVGSEVGRPGETYLPVDLDLALNILSDPRFSVLWPQLLTWAGSDLSRLRDKRVDFARDAWEAGASGEARNTSESLTRAPTRAALQYASALSRAGRTSEALAFLDTESAKFDFTKGASAFEGAQLLTRAASIAWAAGETDIALDRLEALRTRLAAFPEYTINADVNRAAMLAEAGHYAPALALIDDVVNRFDGTAETAGNMKLRGSNAQFDWIRACALNGLGKTTEAKELFASLPNGTGSARDRGAIVPQGVAIRVRAAACMNDGALLAESLISVLPRDSTVFNPAIVELQPGRQLRTGAQAYAVARNDPRLRALIAGRYRDLPPALVPALNMWRMAPAS